MVLGKAPGYLTGAFLIKNDPVGKRTGTKIRNSNTTLYA
jgi:hypothetical protein